MTPGSVGASLEHEGHRAVGSSPRADPVDAEQTTAGGGAAGPAQTSLDRTRTRISASWTAVVTAVGLLLILVVFIAENTQRSTVNFVGVHGHAPTAVALLIAAIAGALIVVIVGAARMLQLRRSIRHSVAPHR